MMGHDIMGYNKAGAEIAYARFSMGNYNALILYNLLDAENFYAGVSGCGDFSTFSLPHMEKALNEYQQKYGKRGSGGEVDWDLKQIRDFIENCLKTAQQEGSIRVYFG